MIYSHQDMLTITIDACEAAGEGIESGRKGMGVYPTTVVMVPSDSHGTPVPSQVVLRLDQVTMWRQYDEHKSQPTPTIDLYAVGLPPLTLRGPGVVELGRLLNQRFVS